jgi:ABC-type Fe3+ transport system permease subunit
MQTFSWTSIKCALATLGSAQCFRGLQTPLKRKWPGVLCGWCVMMMTMMTMTTTTTTMTTTTTTTMMMMMMMMMSMIDDDDDSDD